MNAEFKKLHWKRNKTIAILIAVFLGPWTWLYTYRRDPVWASAGLGLSISTMIQFTTARIGREIHPVSGFDDSLAYVGLWAILTALGAWIVAIATTFVAKQWSLDGPENRNKTAALIIGILLGPWTWLYTYKKDYWKFWPAVIIGIGARGAEDLLPNKLSDVVHSFWLPLFLAIWVLSIVLAAIRKDQWYKTYSE